MKKLLKNSIFQCILIALMTCSFTTNAQTTQKPDLDQLTPIIKGMVVKYTVHADYKDTVYNRIELSATAAFISPQVFYRRTNDTTRSYSDTARESQGLAPAPAGYYVRIWTVSKNRKDSIVSITDFVTTLEPVQTPTLKVVQVLPHQSGSYFSMNLFSGNQTEKLIVQYKYSYDSIHWSPAGAARTFIGKIVSAQDSITGLFANLKIFVNISYSNSKGMDDTTFKFITTLMPTKPVIEITQIIPGMDQVEIKGIVTTFNLKTALTITCGTYSKTDTFQSLKAEPFSFVIKSLPTDTKVSGTIIAKSPKGSSPAMPWDSRTLQTPVQPTLTVNTVYISSGGITIDWSWRTASDNLFTRVDAKIYTDSTEQNPAKSIEVSEQDKLNKQSGTSMSPVALDPGTYWVRLKGEVSKGTYPKSNLYMFTVKFSAKTPVVKVAPTGPIQCNLYDMSGKLLETNYTVDPKINIFDSNIAKGNLIAVPVRDFAPFRIYSNGGRCE